MILQRLTYLLSTQPRPEGVEPKLLVLHATAGASAKSTIDYLRNKGTSYHFIIARDSRDSPWSYMAEPTEALVYQCVRYHHKASHVSSTIPVPGSSGSINENSIGISLANYQGSVKNDPAGGLEEYTGQQILALNALLALVHEEVPSIQMITCHADVQPWSRSDPIGIDVSSYVERFGWVYWKPTSSELERHRPRN